MTNLPIHNVGAWPITPFNRTSTSFGRHQTFALRFGWLTKGFHALLKDPLIFQRDDATVTLGVGKNMVEAIRYWLCAIRLVNPNNLTPLPVGHLILDPSTGLDPYLETEGTLWLLHWLLASNTIQATGIYWFFHYFHRPDFTANDLHEALQRFVIEQGIKAASSTLKSDAALLPRLYTQSNDRRRGALEDALDSPLALLGLMQSPSGAGGRTRSIASERPDIPCEILAYAVTELFNAGVGITGLPFSVLWHGDDNLPALGAVFRLTESGLLGRLEQLVTQYPHDFLLRDTAGLIQLYALRQLPPEINYLHDYYKK